jgi:hypothetical protein
VLEQTLWVCSAAIHYNFSNQQSNHRLSARAKRDERLAEYQETSGSLTDYLINGCSIQGNRWRDPLAACRTWNRTQDEPKRPTRPASSAA